MLRSARDLVRVGSPAPNLVRTGAVRGPGLLGWLGAACGDLADERCEPVEESAFWIRPSGRTGEMDVVPELGGGEDQWARRDLD
jgi:hypothetical protein